MKVFKIIHKKDMITLNRDSASDLSKDSLSLIPIKKSIISAINKVIKK
jgi:hypothetical protein